MDFFANILGTFGAIMIVVAYSCIQLEKLKPEDIGYILLNIFGSLTIIFSLVYSFNFPALLINLVWLSVGIYGLKKKLK